MIPDVLDSGGALCSDAHRRPAWAHISWPFSLAAVMAVPLGVLGAAGAHANVTGSRFLFCAAGP